MNVTEVVESARVIFLDEGLDDKAGYEDVVKSGLALAGIAYETVQSEYLETPTREEGIRLIVNTGFERFSTITPPLQGYVAPLFLWSFLNQILDHVKPDHPYYFYETYTPAIVFMNKNELKTLLDHQLTWIHPNWATVETSNQMRFKNQGKEITAVAIEILNARA